MKTPRLRNIFWNILNGTSPRWATDTLIVVRFLVTSSVRPENDSEVLKIHTSLGSPYSSQRKRKWGGGGWVMTIRVWKRLTWFSSVHSISSKTEQCSECHLELLACRPIYNVRFEGKKETENMKEMPPSMLAVGASQRGPRSSRSNMCYAAVASANICSR